ncbi:MAG: hypothetical protein ABWZ17_06385 [Candidatus Binatia bacterium]
MRAWRASPEGEAWMAGDAMSRETLAEYIARFEDGPHGERLAKLRRLIDRGLVTHDEAMDEIRRILR